ncbi:MULTISPECIES: hypothetical protein [Thalassobaculum]|uniref:DUF2188 domain-containing protein n=1 Tax=Thalassobaculum litoreum DSM 18839 TaxID=1123362 RepID=A0A8G2EYB3_9PROT|nr:MULTISPECIES: hypothetical protein [Thalassobaculum]SDF55915.1 hypothetical protein SAMN05660686_01666 [Thalassobaculum litoreum DSM 18839]
MAQSLYEVHTLKGGQWVIDSTYPDKDTSIEVAKQLHGEKRFEGIKVIKDTFDPKTGQGKELVVFDTSKAPKERSAPPPPAAAKSAEAAAAAPAAAAPRAKKKPKNQDVSVALKATGWLVAIVIGGLGVLFLINKAGALFSKGF